MSAAFSAVIYSSSAFVAVGDPLAVGHFTQDVGSDPWATNIGVPAA